MVLNASWERMIYILDFLIQDTQVTIIKCQAFIVGLDLIVVKWILLVKRVCSILHSFCFTLSTRDMLRRMLRLVLWFHCSSSIRMGNHSQRRMTHAWLIATRCRMVVNAAISSIWSTMIAISSYLRLLLMVHVNLKLLGFMCDDVLLLLLRNCFSDCIYGVWSTLLIYFKHPLDTWGHGEVVCCDHFH